MNKLLQRQIKEYLKINEQTPEEFTNLFLAISDSYDHFERDQIMMESSLEVSSKEMMELNTALKNEKDELKKTHEELNTLFDNIDEVFYSADMLANKLIQVSTASEKIYGYTPAEFLADADLYQKLLYPRDSHFTEEEHKKISLGIQVCSQYQIIHKDKSIRWVENKITPSLDETGRLIRIDGVTSDVTERKNAEAALSQKDSRFAIASQIAKLGYWELDVLKGEFTFNDDFYAIFKTSTQAVGGNTLTVERYAELFIYPDDREIVGREVAKAVNSPDPHFSRQLEHRIVYADGTMGYMSVGFYIVKNEEGQTVKTYGINQDVTERRNAEEKIKESELRYRSLIEQATDTICITDANFKFIEVNFSASRIFGFSKTEFLQLSVKDVLFTEDLHSNPLKIEALKAGIITHNERRIKRKDGTALHVELNSKMLEDGRIIIFGRDITERKKAADKLIESEYRYRSLIEQATDAICIADASMKVIDVNTSCCQMLGYSKEECLLLSVTDVFLAEDLQINPFKMEELILGKTIRSERIMMKKDGTLIEVEMSGKMLEDGRFILFGHDIAERKKAEQLIKDSELRYRSLIEHATDAICIADYALKFMDVNPYACNVLGYTKAEALQLGVTDVIFAEDLITNPIKLYDLQLGEVIRNERRLKKKDGTAVVMDITTTLMEDGRVILFGHDITARKKAEAALLLSEANLEIKNNELKVKNKELEQFAYVASHDLQEPLRTTTGFIDLIKKQYHGKLDEKADKYLDFISEASARMKVLINDLLDLSKIGHNRELKQVDCYLILQDVMKDLDKSITDSNAKITFHHLPVINGYPTEIKQLFQNLVINAIKFRKQDIPPEINISSKKTGSYWQFSFSDNGIGIKKDYYHRIFIIFQRLHGHSEYSGSGIGLSHCKKIVELHHGEIWVESIPGQGSTFFFTILLSDGSQ